MRVELSKEARKVLARAPKYIVTKLLAWVDLVETEGLEEARKRPGYHEEPLKGDLRSKRSIDSSFEAMAGYLLNS